MEKLQEIIHGSTRLVSQVLGLLLIIELSMRLAGFYLDWEQRHADGAVASGEIRILTLGESTTAEYVTPGVIAWPRLLERELRARGLNVRVINRGRIATTSLMIIKSLNSVLAATRPHLVISMMGVNDVDFSPFKRFGLVENPGTGVLSQIRILKLWRLIRNWHEFFAPEQPVMPYKERDFPLLNEVADALKRGHEDLAQHLIDRSLAGLGEVEKAHFFAILSDRVMLSSRSSTTGVLKSYAYRREEMRNHLGNPGSAEMFLMLSKTLQDWEGYRWLAEQYLARNERPSDGVFSLFLGYPGEQPVEIRQLLEKHHFTFREESGKREHIRENYRILYSTLAERNVCLVAMQYPRLPLDELKSYFTASAIEHGKIGSALGFLENRTNFEEALRHAPYGAIFTDRFAGRFGHLTQAGNDLIAHNVAGLVEKILRQGDCNHGG
jgi:lysophospholipase L1-like esterase